MDNLIIWTIIALTSFILGWFHYSAGYEDDIDKRNFYYKFLTFYRYIVNYFLTCVILYYFVSKKGFDFVTEFTWGDLFLSVIFLIGIFGFLPYFIKNITEGIQAIFKRLLDR